jgi:predicted kinase
VDPNTAPATGEPAASSAGTQTPPNTLICGPPCAGKTTWIERHAKPGAPIICYDTIARELGWNGYDRPPFKLGRAAEAEVQRRLERVATGDTVGAYIIRTAAGHLRREELAKRLHARIVLLIPDGDELERRAMQRANPQRTLRDIDRWLEREAQG